MKRNVMIHLATAISIFTASSALAHHSHALFYDSCKKVTIEGRVESAQWKNQHLLIVFKMDNGTTYTAEWTSLQGLTNNSVAGSGQAADGGSARPCHRKSITRSGSNRRQLPDYKRYLEHENRGCHPDSPYGRQLELGADSSRRLGRFESLLPVPGFTLRNCRL